MESETFWAVSTNSDLAEGRGRQYVKHFCRVQATALRLARRGYVQGTDCPVEPVNTIVLDGKHFLPTSILKVEEPTIEDQAAQRLLDSHDAAVAKAKAAGLSDADIVAIIRGRP